MSSRGAPRRKKIGRPAGGEAGLVDLAAELSQDPYGFVIAAFPWKEAGGELADQDGPDDWQKAVLEQVGAGILNLNEAFRIAIAKGHGVGGSALICWLIEWAMTTCPDTRGVVTANTEAQLRTKTWAELAKWHRMSLWNHWFILTATAIYSADPAHEKTWRIDAVPWSEKNTEAFAGLHNYGKRLIVIYDEASAIPPPIWETTEGALTDQNTEIIWLVNGNPTRNTGRFRDCFGSLRHRWTCVEVDSRSSKFANKKQIEEWIADYGEDSDFVRVRVKGQFPRAGSMQFISAEVVEAAMTREPMASLSDALVVGVDVARFGDDESVICIRKGRDCRTHGFRRFRGVDTMELAAQVAIIHEALRPDAIFVDETGVGGGVVDRLRQLRVPCLGIQFGAKADFGASEGVKYANKRAEIWGSMREWLKGGAIPNDLGLRADLVGLEYGLNGKDAIQLERKEDMKKRGLPSPDAGDALALTFAYPVQPHQDAGGAHKRDPRFAVHDYDPYASA